MDVSGEHHLDVFHSVFKTRLSVDGQPIQEESEQYDLGAANKEDEGAQKTAKETEKEEPAEEKEVKKEVKKDECGR